MWIRGVIVHPNVLLSCLESEEEEFRKFLREYDIKLFGFSNDSDINRFFKIEVELGGKLITSNDVGEKKGSPKWIEYIERKYAIPHNRLVYIGYGTKKYDWATAVNSSVFYIHYSKGGIHEEVNKYALKFGEITDILNLIRLFFSDSPLYTYREDLDERTKLRILFDAGTTLRDYEDKEFRLQDLFKYGEAFHLGKRHRIDAPYILFLLLIVQLWKEGLASKGDLWCVYPSSKKGKVSQNMEPYIILLRGLTGARYYEVFERIEDTVDKSEARFNWEHHKICDTHKKYKTKR